MKHLEIKIQMLLLCSKLCFNLPMHVQSREEEMGWEQNYNKTKKERKCL